MHYLLLIPIALVFGAAFFGLGWYACKETMVRFLARYDILAKYPSKEYYCSPRWIYFKGNKRVFPHPESIDQFKDECDTILHVEKCRGELTDIMVVFKSKFTAINGRLRDFNAFPCLPVDLQALKRRLHCPTCGSAYLKGTSQCPTCGMREGA